MYYPQYKFHLEICDGNIRLWLCLWMLYYSLNCLFCFLFFVFSPSIVMSLFWFVSWSVFSSRSNILLRDFFLDTKFKTLCKFFKIQIVDVETCGRQLVERGFDNSLGDLGSIRGHVIPNTLKMVLDTSLLNTQQYKVRIDGKLEQSRESSCALPYTSVL